MTRLLTLTQKSRRVLASLPHTLGLMWDANGSLLILWCALLVAQALLPVATVYLTKDLVDSVVAGFGGRRDWESLRPALFAAAKMAAVMALAQCLRSAAGVLRTANAGRLRDHISGLIHQKSCEVDYGFYEQADFHDHLHRARSEAGYRPVALVESLGSLVQDALTLAAMLAVLAPFGWRLPLLLLVSTAPALLVVLHSTLNFYEWQRRVTKEERRAWYYDWLLTSAEAAAEVRLFDLGGRFRAAYAGIRERLRRDEWRMALRQGAAECAVGALGIVVTSAALGWVGWRAWQGAATLGTLALFVQAFNQGQQLARSLLGNFGQLYVNGLFLTNLFEFLSLQPRLAEPERPAAAPEYLREGIRFERVAFRYPGSGRAALEDFSLEVPAGRVVALVGLNGSGKTTLVKLLCRLYDPDAGRITIDGVDLREMRVGELRRLLTVLFQQPLHYHTTVAENIGIGARGSAPSDAEIEGAAEAAGAAEVIERLPCGYETTLGKRFGDGAELSVGEWQRLALARALLRRSPVMLLDEPTSAMDAWAEGDWLRRFRALAAGRTVLIITHRYTTAMRADLVYVMAEGRVLESGTHEELLRAGGVYASSWPAQVAAGREAESEGVCASRSVCLQAADAA